MTRSSPRRSTRRSSPACRAAADARHRRQGGRSHEALTPEFKLTRMPWLPTPRRLAQPILAAGYKLVTGGTDNHLMLVDLTPKGLTGKAAEAALDRADITCNKNGIPFDPQKPTVTSASASARRPRPRAASAPRNSPTSLGWSSRRSTAWRRTANRGTWRSRRKCAETSPN